MTTVHTDEAAALKEDLRKERDSKKGSEKQVEDQAAMLTGNDENIRKTNEKIADLTVRNNELENSTVPLRTQRGKANKQFQVFSRSLRNRESMSMP